MRSSETIPDNQSQKQINIQNLGYQKQSSDLNDDFRQGNTEEGARIVLNPKSETLGLKAEE